MKASAGMLEKTARTHSHVSNRAKIRDGGERKVVFKGVLDNPFRIHWPSIPLDVLNTVLADTLAALDGIAEYRTSRKRRRNSAQEQTQKKQKMHSLPAGIGAEEPSEMQAIAVDGFLDAKSEKESSSEQPTISQHLVIGINEVTKRLETQIRYSRVTLVATTDTPVKDPPSCPLQLILVCRADINPPILVDHLPHLVAAYNSLEPQVLLKLVPLPTGAELLLSGALGLRRAAVLGIDSDWSLLSTFMTSMASVPTLSATWLASSISLQKFVPTHIKQIRTSAPKDMKGEKQRRKEEKALKKEGAIVLKELPTRHILSHSLSKSASGFPYAKMLLAVVGPCCSGKKEIQKYYVSVHGFTPVRILNQEDDLRDSEDQFKIIEDESLSPVDDDGVAHLPSMQAAITSPAPTSSHQSIIPNGQALSFSSASALLRYATAHWRQNFVTTDLRTRTLVKPFVRRPFFMLLSVEASLTTRFLRSREKSLEKFVQEDDRVIFGVETSDSVEISDFPQRDPSCLLNLQDMVNAHVTNSFVTLRGLHKHLAMLDLLNPEKLRPGWDAYFMTLASLASQRSNCMKRRVGAVLVRENRVVSTGYNGTARGLPNCNEGGCSTCNGTTLTPQTSIECVCLHAEENALLEAGRERVGTNAVLYCNTCPCLRCTVKIIQTGVKAVVYNLTYKVDDMSASLFQEAGVELRRYNLQKEFRWFPGDHASS